MTAFSRRCQERKRFDKQFGKRTSAVAAISRAPGVARGLAGEHDECQSVADRAQSAAGRQEQRRCNIRDPNALSETQPGE
jgi:hypothetical protein